MRVILNRTIACPEFTGTSGDVVDVEEVLANRLINFGYACYAESVEPVILEEIRTASEKIEEAKTATIPNKKGKK